jgi:hypothetical protein
MHANARYLCCLMGKNTNLSLRLFLSLLRRLRCSFICFTSSVCRSTNGVSFRARRRAILVIIIGCDVVVVGPVVVALSSTLRILLVISFRCVGSIKRNRLPRRGRATYTTWWEANLQVVHNPGDLLLVVHVINQRLAEHSTHAFEHRSREMKAFIQTFVRAEETCLECKAVNQAEVFPHHLSRTGFLAFLYREAALIKAEHIIVLAEKPIYK